MGTMGITRRSRSIRWSTTRMGGDGPRSLIVVDMALLQCYRVLLFQGMGFQGWRSMAAGDVAPEMHIAISMNLDLLHVHQHRVNEDTLS